MHLPSAGASMMGLLCLLSIYVEARVEPQHPNPDQPADLQAVSDFIVRNIAARAKRYPCSTKICGAMFETYCCLGYKCSAPVWEAGQCQKIVKPKSKTTAAPKASESGEKKPTDAKPRESANQPTEKPDSKEIEERIPYGCSTTICGAMSETVCCFGYTCSAPSHEAGQCEKIEKPKLKTTVAPFASQSGDKNPTDAKPEESAKEPSTKPTLEREGCSLLNMCGGIAAVPCCKGFKCVGDGPFDSPGHCVMDEPKSKKTTAAPKDSQSDEKKPTDAKPAESVKEPATKPTREREGCHFKTCSGVRAVPCCKGFKCVGWGLFDQPGHCEKDEQP